MPEPSRTPHRGARIEIVISLEIYHAAFVAPHIGVRGLKLANLDAVLADQLVAPHIGVRGLKYF